MEGEGVVSNTDLLEKRITALRSGLISIASGGCEGDHDYPNCDEANEACSSNSDYCFPCKANMFLKRDDKLAP